MSTDQSITSGESIEPTANARFNIFAVYRWLFIIGLTSMALRFLGLWGDSDIAAVVKALSANDPATIINDVVVDLVVIVSLFYALLQPKRWVFVLGGSVIFFVRWLGRILMLIGINKGSFTDAMSFMVQVTTASGVALVIASVFPLFGFLAFPPKDEEATLQGRAGMKLVEIGVPVVAGVLLAIVPSFHFTGSSLMNATNIQGVGIGFFVGGGIIAVILGLLRRPNVLLFWGTVMSMTVLETWFGVLRITGPNKPSYWPGLGMIAGILGCLLLLSSEPAARLVTRLLFARRPVITESA